jgi:hypothetical protein
MEVMGLFFQMNNEYIQYLNDPDRKGMNYDQWKEKKKRQKSERNPKSGNGK